MSAKMYRIGCVVLFVLAVACLVLTLTELWPSWSWAPIFAAVVLWIVIYESQRRRNSRRS